MNQLTDKTVSFTGASSTDGRGADRDLMNFFVRALIKLGIRNEDFGYHLIGASMVIIFFFFGYQKWFEYEVERLIPYISNGPLIFWLYPALGMRGATWFLGVSEWTFGTLLFLGFWNRKLGIVGALGSSATFIATVTIIPFMPDGWDAAAGGFPAMTGKCSLPDEGRGSPCDITLPSDAGPPEGIALHWHRRVSAKPKTPAVGEHRRQAQAAGPQ